MAVIGYARVSTDGQTVEAQKQALSAAGVDRVFSETASGAKTDRRELGRALGALADGDTLLVTRLDRLARSTRDLLNILATVAGARAGFRSLTNLPHRRPASASATGKTAYRGPPTADGCS